MEKIRRSLCVFILIGAMMGMNGCLSFTPVREPLPEETLEEFEDALNAMDVDGMLKCMDEQSVKAITAGIDLMMSIAGAATGIEVDISAEDLISMFPLIQEIMGDYADQDEFTQVDFQVMETYIKGDKATVYFTEVNSGDIVAINMVKEKRKWLLTLSTRGIAEEDAERVIIAGQEEEQEKTRVTARTERKDEEEKKRADREKLKEFLRQLLGS